MIKTNKVVDKFVQTFLWIIIATMFLPIILNLFFLDFEIISIKGKANAIEAQKKTKTLFSFKKI